MADEGGPPSGHWAPDPTGRHRFRWWDGTQWTSHVYDGEVAPTGAPSPADAPAATDPGLPPEAVELGAAEAALHRRERRAIQRRSFWTGALAGGLFVALVAALAWVTVGGSDSSSTTTTTRETTTTTEETTTTTIAVTTTTVAPRPPQQVRVQVLNGSGVSGAAATKATSLQGLGYVIAGTADATARQGTVVQCNVGFDSEAAALAQAVGSGATVQPAGTAGTTIPTNADCVVTLGS